MEYATLVVESISWDSQELIRKFKERNVRDIEIMEGRYVMQVSQKFLEKYVMQKSGRMRLSDLFEGVSKAFVFYNSGKVEYLLGEAYEKHEKLIRESKGRNLRINALPEELDMIANFNNQ